MKRAPVAAEDTFVVVSFADAASFLKRGLLPALLLAVLLGGSTWFITSARADEFSARALLLSIRPEAGSATPGTLPPPALDPAIYNLALHQGPALDWLLEDPEVSARWTRHELGIAIRVLSEQTLQSTVIRVETTGNDPAAITYLANKAASALIRWDVSRSTDQLEQWASSLALSVTQLENELQRSSEGSARQLILEERYDTKLIELVTATSHLPGSQLTLLRQARLPDAPNSSHRASSSAIAAILAIIVVYSLQLFQGAVLRAVTGWQLRFRVALRSRSTAQPDRES